MDPIIKTVLENITSFKVNYLPKYKFIRLIYTKSETLGQLQIAQTLVLDSGKSCLKIELRKLENMVKFMTIVSLIEVAPIFISCCPEVIYQNVTCCTIKTIKSRVAI